MKRKISAILILLLFAIGIGFLLYPVISDWQSGQAQTTVIENHNHVVEKLSEEELATLREAAEEYNEGLLANVVLTDPFDESIEREASAEYMSLLNINGDGVMGSVRIPKIDVQLPIYHGTSLETLEKGAGHLENTSLPVGGIGTHSVISAHTGLPTATFFNDLIELEERDLFFLEVLGETLAYEVDRIEVVEPTDTSGLRIDLNEDYVTLVTCTPYGINSHRLLVRGERTEYTPEMEEQEQQRPQTAWNWPYITAALILVFIFVVYTIYRLRKRHIDQERK